MGPEQGSRGWAGVDNLASWAENSQSKKNSATVELRKTTGTFVTADNALVARGVRLEAAPVEISATLTPPSRRIWAVDATRGFAMVFVCLAHFCGSLEAKQPHLAEFLENIAMIATPTFLMISRAMLGLLHVQRSGEARELSSRLFHRGLSYRFRSSGHCSGGGVGASRVV